MKTSNVVDRLPVIKADSIEHYRRKENLRIFGVEEEADKDAFAKVFIMAGKTGVTITANDSSTCHRLPGGVKCPKLLIPKFVLRNTKHQLMKLKRNLKETSIYVNGDLTPLRTKTTLDLRSKDDVCDVKTAYRKVFLFTQDIQKLVFDNLYRL